MQPNYYLFIFVLSLFYSCGAPSEQDHTGQTASPEANPRPEAFSRLGEPLYAPPPTDKLLADLSSAEAEYLNDTTDVDKLIWYGRRMAYLGRYREAIAIYSNGIARFPENARLYRHRGHRYISIREFAEAIADLERAAQLIKGKEDEIEPDGMPNAQNIPLTTLHSNIWYHLGLSYYLRYDWEKALTAFTNCRALGLNDDNLVSSTHWIYMILRRMGREDEAAESLRSIHSDMQIIENFSYYKLCRFYQGELRADELIDAADTGSANDAVRYGLANWYYYNGKKEKAKEALESIISAEGWNSFGHIAAEVDRLRLFGGKVK